MVRLGHLDLGSNYLIYHPNMNLENYDTPNHTPTEYGLILSNSAISPA